MGSFILFILSTILNLMIWAIIISAIISWLVAFNVINLRHPVMYQIAHFFEAVTRPILSPFQRVIPTFGGVDVSPIIAIILLIGLRSYLLPWIFGPIIAALGG
jgi:YggT family protein